MDVARVMTREQLYERVWSEPMRVFAAQLGLSDVGLAKACKRARVPVPGRGYWAKRAAGQKPGKTPLPPLPSTAPANQREVSFTPRPVQPSHAVQTGLVADQTAFESATENRIVVADSLRGAHSLVRITATALRASSARAGQILYNGAVRHLDIDVTRQQLPRALRILDALVRAFGDRGWMVSLGIGDDRKAYVSVFGERVAFAVRERLTKVKNEPAKPVRGVSGQWYTPFRSEHEIVPSGKLSLVIRNTHGHGVHRAWDDTDATRLEERLNNFVVGIVAQAEEQREFTRRADERARQWREAEERRYEAERRRQHEAARIAALDRQVAAWDQSHRIGAYAAAVRTAAQLTGIAVEAGTPLGDWLVWAEDCALRLDPINRPLDTLPTLWVEPR